MPRDVTSAGKMMKGKGGGKKMLHHMSITPAENGHVVEHHFENGGHLGEFHEPETHAFGNDDDHAMLAHVTKHLGIEDADDAKQEEQDGDGGY
jgi:hypothetical protein